MRDIAENGIKAELLKMKQNIKETPAYNTAWCNLSFNAKAGAFRCLFP